MYLGSVRFFRHLFLTIFALLVLVPTCFAIRFYAQGQELSRQYQALKLAVPPIEEAETSQSGANAVLPKPEAPQTNVADAELGYTKKYDDLYVEREEYVPADKCVYLTFDDGPSENTGKILDILKAKNVKATFFVVYRSGPEAEALMKRIVNEGHTIAVHSYSHNYGKIYASVEAFLDDFYLEWNYIYEVTGVKTTVFRFPGGSINSYNSGIYHEIISELLRRGFNYFDWNVSAEDATGAKINSAKICSNIVSNAQCKNRAMVLMHDSAPKKETVQALAPAIEQLQAKGYQFAAITSRVLPVVYPYRDRIV